MSQTLTLNKLKAGDHFILVRTGHKFILVEKRLSKGRMPVDTIDGSDLRFERTLHHSCLVERIKTMKPCRKLLDVMYEQRATIRARIDAPYLSGPAVNVDVFKNREAEARCLNAIDHIIDAYIETWQT